MLSAVREEFNKSTLRGGKKKKKKEAAWLLGKKPRFYRANLSYVPWSSEQQCQASPLLSRRAGAWAGEETGSLVCCNVYSPHLRKKSFNTSAALSSCATSFLILLHNVLSPWLVTYFCTSDMKLKFLSILEKFVPSLCCLVFLTHLGVELTSSLSHFPSFVVPVTCGWCVCSA